MNSDGSAETRLTNDPRYDWQPAWSPDGTKIAFSGWLGSEPRPILPIQPDGSEIRQVGDGDGQRSEPAWSPEGSRIAFQCWFADRAPGSCGMNADGSGATELTNNTGWESIPVWSPDGSRLAYVSEQNLVEDYSGEPVDHPDIPDLFGPFEDGHYPLHFQLN